MWCTKEDTFHLGNANTYKPNHKETESKLREIPETNGLYS